MKSMTRQKEQERVIKNWETHPRTLIGGCVLLQFSKIKSE